MARKPPGELTNHEMALLTIAARLFAALRARAARPPTSAEETYWTTKAKEELVLLTRIAEPRAFN